MYGIYSVKLLFESLVSLNLSSEKIFEERIILGRVENLENINELIYKKIPMWTHI